MCRRRRSSPSRVKGTRDYSLTSLDKVATKNVPKSRERKHIGQRPRHTCFVIFAFFPRLCPLGDSVGSDVSISEGTQFPGKRDISVDMALVIPPRKLKR